jgi:hypothetical protein
VARDAWLAGPSSARLVVPGTVGSSADRGTSFVCRSPLAAADQFNVFDEQTGYNFQPSVHASDFGTARNFYDPRRFQLAPWFQF